MIQSRIERAGYKVTEICKESKFYWQLHVLFYSSDFPMESNGSVVNIPKGKIVTERRRAMND